MEKAHQASRQKQQTSELARVDEQEEDQAESSEQPEVKSKAVQKHKTSNSANAPYRTPEFCWSKVHIRLLDDLLTYIEKVVESWTDSTTAIVDYVSFSHP